MSALRTWLVRVLGYLTNHLVAHLPSFTLRRLWYRRLGFEIGERSGIQHGLLSAGAVATVTSPRSASPPESPLGWSGNARPRRSTTSSISPSRSTSEAS